MKEEELREQLVLLNHELNFCKEAIEVKVRVLLGLSVDIEKIVMRLNKRKERCDE